MTITFELADDARSQRLADAAWYALPRGSAFQVRVVGFRRESPRRGDPVIVLQVQLVPAEQ